MPPNRPVPRTPVKSAPRRHDPPADLTAYNWFLYGEKGIGKTSLAALFPDVTEHQMWEFARPDVPSHVLPMKTWQDCLTRIKTLSQSSSPGRLVIDTVDLCGRACEVHYARGKQATSMGQINDMGATWNALKTEWSNAWNTLLWSGWRVTLISHVRVREKVIRSVARDLPKKIREAHGREAEAAFKAASGILPEVQPTCSGWMYEWSKQVCSVVGCFLWHHRERVLHIRGHESLYASPGGGSVGDSHFLQKKGCDGAGEPLDMLPMGTNPRLAWKNLQAAWDNNLEGFFNVEEAAYAQE